jgi:Ca-activated chloride channel family protein
MHSRKTFALIALTGLIGLVAGCSQQPDPAADQGAVAQQGPSDQVTTPEAEPVEKATAVEQDRSQVAEVADKPQAQAPVAAVPEERSKKEEGRVGKKDARQAADAAESGGVLASLGEGGEVNGVFGDSSLNSDLSGAQGGLVGAKGTQIGSGGLGSRGSGLGGGGTASGLGGLGTKGRGSGSSGYGSGGGSFGAANSPPPPPIAPPVAANSEDYQNYGVNDLVITSDDRLSTFSIDVDTASYTIARRKLTEGTLPPQAAVRVEEFVNYFDYGYETPAKRSSAPFAVHMEAAPSPFEANHHVLRVGVQGANPQIDQAPVHLTFLVDVSGSMSSQDKLPLAKKSLMYLVDNLDEDDTVAIATYAGANKVVLEPTPASERERILDSLAGLRSGGGTAMESGMNLAYNMASETYVHGHENRVIVLSDGDANIGRTGHEDILRTVEHHAEEGITLTTVGFGMGNYKDTMMEQLANQGDGNYFYIDSWAEGQRVFGENLGSTVQTIAKDVKIQVEFNPDAVYAYRLIGYENRDIADVDFRNDQLDAGEIGAGHSVTALYDVVLLDDADDMEIATVRLRAKKPGPDSPAREWSTVFTPDLLHSDLDDASASFRKSVAVASFAELLRGSRYAVEMSYADVFALAQGAVSDSKTDQQLLELIGAAGRLAGERPVVAQN